MTYETKRTEENEGSWAGSNSDCGFYGKKLSDALRAEFKKNRLKNVFVSVQTYTGGQRIYVKFRMTESDYVPYDEYLAKKMAVIDFRQFSRSVFSYKGKRYDMDDCEKLSQNERLALYRECVKDHYERLHNLNKYGENISQFHIKSYGDVLSEGFLNKLTFVKKIVDSFNYDNSDSITDYFDRGFYESYILYKPQVAMLAN